MGKYCFDPSANPYFDETLYEYLQQNGLSDKDFFDALSDTPAYLATPLFQAKINEWQNILRTHHLTEAESDEKNKKRARYNLKKIGTTLAYEGSGRKRKISSRAATGIFIEYKDMVYPLAKEICSYRNPNRGVLKLKDKCPAIKDKARYIVDNSETPQELSFNILSALYHISYGSVEKFIKEHQKMMKGTNEVYKKHSLPSAEEYYREHKRISNKPK
jgi:hypothetical protein